MSETSPLTGQEIQIASFTASGMTWGNWGKGEGMWNLDHIKPLASFDLAIKDQQLEACYYTNLQPLWEKDNMSKGGTPKRIARWFAKQEEADLACATG